MYDQRLALGLSIAGLADRADMTIADIECIEAGGSEPAVALLRRPAAPLGADVRLPPGTTSAPYGSNPAQPELISPATWG